MSNIETRLKKLESIIRLYHFAFIALLLCGGFFILTAFNKHRAVPDLIQAKEFQVVNDAGKVLLTLRDDPNGGGLIETYNKAGKYVIALESSEFGGRFTLANNNGKGRNVIAVTDGDDGIISVKNTKDVRICAMGGDDKNNGVLNVYNAAGANMNALWPKD